MWFWTWIIEYKRNYSYCNIKWVSNWRQWHIIILRERKEKLTWKLPKKCFITVRLYRIDIICCENRLEVTIVRKIKMWTTILRINYCDTTETRVSDTHVLLVRPVFPLPATGTCTLCPHLINFILGFNFIVVIQTFYHLIIVCKFFT